TDLSTLCVGSKKVHNFDTSHEHFSFNGLIFESRSGSVNGPTSFSLHFTSLINRLADHVENTSQNAFSHRSCDHLSSRHSFHIANQTIRAVHRNSSHDSVTTVLSHFKN